MCSTRYSQNENVVTSPPLLFTLYTVLRDGECCITSNQTTHLLRDQGLLVHGNSA